MLKTVSDLSSAGRSCAFPKMATSRYKQQTGPLNAEGSGRTPALSPHPDAVRRSGTVGKIIVRQEGHGLYAAGGLGAVIRLRGKREVGSSILSLATVRPMSAGL